MKKNVETLSQKLRDAFHTENTATRRILLVDDDSAFCELIAKKARNDFYAEIIPVFSITHARQLLDYGEEFYGIILDARLTNGTGVALYRDILKKRINIPVVFLTGYDSPHFRAEVLEVGPAPVVEKGALFRDDFMDNLLAQIGVARRPKDKG